MEPTNRSRRKFVKKMAYIPPAIVTLTVLPAFHANGSGWEQHGNNGVGNGDDPQPPGNPPFNDGFGTGPGMPGNNGRFNR
jgi:hypothetical protein